MRFAALLVVVVLLGLLTSVAAAQAQVTAESLDEAVTKAIAKGVKNLWDQRQADGSWPAASTSSSGFSMGPTALAAYALLENGVSPQDERMAATLDWLAKHDDDKTYSHAVRCQVWLIVNRKTNNKYQKEFEADVKRLILSAWDGAYMYDAKGTGKEHHYDNSNSQFGVLGVWAGARANMEFIDAKYWQAVAKHWLKYQHPDGAWDYAHTGPDPRPTMTAAGVATLFVCMDNLPNEGALRCRASQGPGHKAVQRGLAWLERNFEDSLREESYIPSAWSAFMPYYLYGIERVGLASGYKYFGKSDWYKTGARWLLRKQGKSGGWGAQYDTAFALLFLARGRNPVLFNKLEYKGDWNNRPRALANLTEYIGKSFEATVNWQIVNLKSAVSEWHDAPILYLSGSKAPSFTEEELGKLRAYVQQGGTILSVRECQGAAFVAGMKRIYAKLFPDYELVPVPRDHALYSVHFRLRGRPRLLMVSNGVRPLAIHVEDDVALPWQARMEKTQAWAYKGAANIFLYVTDKGSLRARGVNHWPAEPASAPSRKVKVARLKYAGNWNPEPLAYERLSRLLAADVGLGLDVATTEIKLLPSSGAAVATLTGTTALQASAEEQEALRQFVTAGGLLVVDAAGGARAFAKSAEALLGEVFGGTRIRRLPATSSLYTDKQIKEFKYRRQTRERAGNLREPLLKGIMLGDRLGVVYSREDLTCGLVGCASYACDGYTPETAYEIMRNVMLLAAGGKAGPASAPAVPTENSVRQ